MIAMNTINLSFILIIQQMVGPYWLMGTFHLPALLCEKAISAIQSIPLLPAPGRKLPIYYFAEKTQAVLAYA
jgi:hypothetical protein